MDRTSAMGWSVAAGLLLAGAAALRADDADADMKKMAGRWKVAEMSMRGRPAPAEVKQAISFEFAAGKMKLVNTKRPPADAEMNFTLKLDAGKNPRTFDATALDGSKKGSKLEGIYAFEGGKLRLALPNRPNSKRPAGFGAAQAAGDVAVFVLEPPVAGK